MHVLIANNIYPPIMAGGAELIVSYLAEGLAARGHRVTVVSTCGPEMEPYPREHRNGVDIIRFFPKNRYWSFARDNAGRRSGLETARWHLQDAWNRDAGRRLSQIFESARPDLLHTHLIDGISATIWHQARRRHLPVIHTAHDYHLLCPRAFLLDRSWNICTRPALACRAFRAWHLRTTEDVDLFVSPSQFLLDLHVDAGLRCADKAVVRNGVPLPRRAPTPRAGAPSRFLLLARLTVEKGVRVVLEAMRALPPDLPLSLTIAGRGPLEAEVRDAATSDPRITFAGYIEGDAKHHALQNADHLLLPSLWYENAPVVILEAATYGLHLIASRIGGIPEFVREGRTGTLFAPGDSAALAAAMRAAAQDGGVLDAVPAHAADLIAESSVQHMVEAYLGQYARLLDRPAEAKAA